MEGPLCERTLVFKSHLMTPNITPSPHGSSVWILINYLFPFLDDVSSVLLTTVSMGAGQYSLMNFLN